MSRVAHRTYDEYKSELASGELTWSPPHKNDDFWRDNAHKLVDRDREQLKCVALPLSRSSSPPPRSGARAALTRGGCDRVLVHILMSSHDATTLAVAANDLAQFVKFYDNAKKCVPAPPRSFPVIRPSRSCRAAQQLTSPSSLPLPRSPSPAASLALARSLLCRAIDDLGAKARVMELMTHADPDVKYQSLVATQRLLSHAWA